MVSFIASTSKPKPTAQSVARVALITALTVGLWLRNRFQMPIANKQAIVAKADPCNYDIMLLAHLTFLARVKGFFFGSTIQNKTSMARHSLSC